MKMYERLIPESETVLNEFCKVEGCHPDQVKANTNKDEVVKLRDRFTAFAYLKGIKPDEMSLAINRHRCNFYYTMKKDNWRDNIRRYEQL